MKIQTTKSHCASALVALALPLSAAQTSSQSQRSSTRPNNQGDQYQNNQNEQYRSTEHGMSSNQKLGSSQNCRASKILDANAKSRDGKDLGEVEDPIVNPTTGKIDFVVLGQGGVLGIGEDHIPVPWRAVTVQSDGNTDRKSG